jgi:DHA2 family multidrug resistance protein-like MFS transporter
MAVLGSVLAASYGNRVGDLLPGGLSPEAQAAAGEGIGGALAVAASLPSEVGDAVVHAGRTAYLSGMRVTDIVAALVMVGMALVTGVLLRGGRPTGSTTCDPHGDPQATAASPMVR